ncbi:uncharacterized protein K452DRAFT_287164 [Aplosporella prunicola CBS 121167]|uniref:Uncharacterized protein n=1 Tax=Aplosporella prunicola CBS 121167 TaxID=1176127 RepID=A0A6A6BF18_9PEZI|nr:uncharacterized protein K452DRAFT_287164 [Aplosporella prunicola CBS 121167]KAF2141973.1 hypothetical protein K452DRAFT_287164 [Aplosporella prunicola CBS 121167]
MHPIQQHTARFKSYLAPPIHLVIHPFLPSHSLPIAHHSFPIPSHPIRSPDPKNAPYIAIFALAAPASLGRALNPDPQPASPNPESDQRKRKKEKFRKRGSG